MLWGARASYETTSTSADSFTSGSSVLDNLENVASKVRLGIELFVCLIALSNLIPQDR